MLNVLRSLLMTAAYRTMRVYWAIVGPVTSAVRIMLIKDGTIVMVKQTYTAGWHFPGGMVDKGETLREAAEREAREEVGIQCRSPSRLFGVYSNFAEGKSDHIAVFLCEDFEITPSPDRWEIEAIEWFPLEALPEDASGGSKRRMAEYLAGDVGIAARW